MKRKPITFFAAALACWATFALAHASHRSGPQDTTARQLVVDLGDANDAVRARSEEKLMSLGEDAVAELKKGSQSVDVEISSRCHRILGRLEKSLKGKKEKAFLDADETVSAKMAAWQEFKSLLEEDSKESRKLYLSICHQHSKLFKDLQLTGLEDDSAKGAVSLARTAVSMLDPGRYSDIDIVMGFVFVDHLARARLAEHADSAEVQAYQKQRQLDILKALNYLVENSRLNVGWHHPCRKSLERMLAKWYRLIDFDQPSISAFARNRIVYSSLNEILIQELATQYESLDRKTKFELLEILDHYCSTERSRRRKLEKAKVIQWLDSAFKDETVLATTRLRAKPGSEIEVTAKQLSLAIASRLVSDSNARKKLTAWTFGNLPLYSRTLQILKDKSTEKRILDQISALPTENQQETSDGS